MLFDKLSLQKQYADLLGPRLHLYKVLSYAPYKANFRCPICGDSSTHKFKKRGYILERGDNLQYYCHNGCGSFSFEKFLETYHDDLFREYKFDIIKQKQSDKKVPVKIEAIQILSAGPLQGLTQLSILPKTHPANLYISNRKIIFDDLYYTDTFFEYINNIIPGKFDSNLKDHPRIIIPLRREDGSVFGVSARAIDNNKTKYIIIKFDEEHPKIFGLDRLNKNKHVFVLEGPIDSMFFDNAIALLGVDGIPKWLNNFTLIMDNQPRNKEVVEKYEKYISQGVSIFIWPSNIEQKDINDLILAGYSKEDILQLVQQNTFSGLQASIRFKNWRKYEEIPNKSRKFYSR